MSNQTVSVSKNFDDATILGLANGEDITIDTNALLTINSDNRHSQNSAVIGNLTMSSASGGRCLIDGRDVWWIPFDNGLGLVPALGTVAVDDVTGSISGTGEFLGVYASMGEFPLTAGGAMPATGFIKFRKVTSAFADNEVMTFAGGATADVNSATGGQRGWLHIVGERQQVITVPRLGKFETQGDWFYLADTDGSDDQQISYPVYDHIPAIQIETAPASGIYEWYLNAGNRWNTATVYVPTDVRGKFFGQWHNTFSNLTTTNASPTITGFSDTSNLRVGMPFIMSGGFASTTELYIVSIVPNVSINVQINANSSVVGTATARSIFPNLEIARRVSNSCGYKPASGCKIRIPNIFISTTGNGGFAGQILSSTQGDRWEFLTTSAGEIDINNVTSNIYLNMSSPYSVNITESSITGTLTISNTASTTILNDVAIRSERDVAINQATFSNLFSGLELTNVRMCRYDGDGAGDVAMTLADVDGAIFTDVMVEIFGSLSAITRGNADVRTMNLTRVNNSTFTRFTGVGGKLSVAQCQNVLIDDYRHADQINGLTVNTNPLTSAIDLNSSCIENIVNGFSNFAGLANVHPYNAIVSTTSGNLGIKVRNIGTPASPYNCGSANQCARAVTGSVTKDLELKRIYLQNTRTDAVSLANTIQDIVVDNVWGDGADTNAIAGVNCLIRGARWTNSVTGQTSVYGRHWEDAFISTTAGRLLLAMNEPLSATMDQVTIVSGTPKFTSVGTISMPTLGDQVIFEMPYMCIGHTALANIAPTLTGTNTGNFSYEYQIDLGSGYNGSWLALTGANLSSHAIPAFVSLFNQGGFKLKIRVTVTVASVTNALTYIRIDTVTTAIEQQRQYPFYNPIVGYSNTLTGSKLAIFSDSSNELADEALDDTGNTLATPPWDANYSAILRLRKAGYGLIENTVSILETGNILQASQVDNASVPDTDPGLLGITVINHGASPVVWNSKNWSITIKTTDDGLTASQIANYINYNISQFASFNGFHGFAWPEMILSNGTLSTMRGRLIGSLGATLKGVRVVRNDDTTAVVGFTQMQSDDGTYWVAPIPATISITGLTANSRLFIKNITTNTVIHNAIIGGTSYTNNYDNGTLFTGGDTYEVRVTYVNGATAKRPVKYVGTANTTGFTIAVVQENWTEYISAGVDGSSVTECDTDYVNIQVDIDDLDNETYKSRIAGFIVYAMHAQAQGIEDWFDVINYKSAGSAVIRSSVAVLKIDNVKPTALRVVDAFQLRMDDGSSMVDTSSNTIVWDNSSEAVVIETGTSGLTPTEATTLAKLDTLTEDVSGLRFTTKALETAGGGGLTASAIADAVWDEVASGHVAVGSMGELMSFISSIKAKTDQLTFTGANVNSIAQVVSDKTGYALTTGDKNSIATIVESALLNEGDGQQLIDAIVLAIGNSNVDEIALVSAIRADLERANGPIDSINTKTGLIPALV